jgi:hypothetical protein
MGQRFSDRDNAGRFETEASKKKEISSCRQVEYLYLRE